MNDHRVTSEQVARRAGVSRTTVSFVLNGVYSGKVSHTTRQRVLEAANALGYVPDAAARTLVSGKTGTIGLVVSRAEHIRVDAFVPQILDSLTRTCMRHGYRLLIETSDDSQTAYDYHQLVGSKQIDGLVVLNPDPEDDRLSRLIDRKYPIALIGAYPHPDVAAVSVDSAAAMDKATNHLIHLGHERIGFIHYRHLRDLSIGGRFGGYRSALAKAGIGLNEQWIRSGNYSAESGYEAMNSLLSERDVPTAVVTANDTIAVGTIAAIVQSGKRVPDDIAVVGFDDIPLARYVAPALTTVRLPAGEMAEECALMILNLIEGRFVEIPKRVFQADLVIRDSCGALSCTKSLRS